MRIILEGHSEGTISVVGTAHNGKEAVALAADTGPDVILMDIRMPVMDGVEATRLIHESHPEIRIMILTTFDDDDLVFSALKNGASGYVLKNIEPEDLVASVRAIQQGTLQMSPAIGEKLLKQALDGMRRQRLEDAEYHGRINYMTSIIPSLTRREAEVLDLVVRDLDNAEIAEELGIAQQTVRNYVSIIYGKIGVADRNHAKRLVRRLLADGSQTG
jgi:DNA-binding NarL/FixJ family response regulator